MKKILPKFYTFFKYVYSSGICYLIDLFIFTILSFSLGKLNIVQYIMISTVSGKFISSIVNFYINKNKVFLVKNNNKEEILNLLLNYYLLVIIQSIVASIGIEIVFKLSKIPLIIVKLIVDILILSVNYFIQKKYIFNNRYINFKQLLISLRKFVKENKAICIIMIISLILHCIVLATLGFSYSLESDDLSYIASGIYFKNNLTIIMHGVISAQIMPGMTYLIALISYFTGEGLALMICLKIIWMIMGVLSILGVYKIVRIFSNKFFSVLSAAFLLVIDFIWMDNLILTETPFMFGFIFLIFASLMLGKTKKQRYFYQIIVWYLFCVLLKANIAPYPLFLIVYLIFEKYDLKILIKQLLISAGILLIFFVPWTIRNYIRFNDFIPLTYGGGNPLLLGTYQGYNYPDDNEEEYEEYIKNNASDEMKEYLEGSTETKEYMQKYYSLKKDGLIAKYRMKKWWNNDKRAMLRSYFLYKPKTNIYCSFFWTTLYNITSTQILKLRMMDIILAIIGIFAINFNKRHINTLVFLLINYFFQIAVYSYTFAFNRYAQTLFFIRFVIIGIGLQIIYDTIKKKHKNKKLGEEND